MITPSEPAAVPAQYDAVPLSNFDIQAPQTDLSGACDAAVSATMPRQADARQLLESPAGYGAVSISSGSSGGGGEDWPSDLRPGA